MTSEPAHTPPDGRKLATRRAILDAASDRFAQEGIAGAQVTDIAAAANVSVGAIYKHFGSKQGLALAFVEEALDAAASRMQDARSHASPIARVYAAGDAYFRFALEYPAAARFAAARVLAPIADPEFEEVQQAISRRVQEMVLAVATDLRAAMEAGEVIVVPVEEAMVYLWGMWNGVTALMLRTDGAAIPPELALRSLETARRTIEVANDLAQQHGLPDWVSEREAQARRAAEHLGRRSR